MIIFLAHHFIKPECVAAYREAILANAWLTSQEPGVLRFEVMQDTADPTHFCLLEMYRDVAARTAHLETAHFLQFKEAVLGQQMFARRGEGYDLAALFPEPESW